MGKGTLKYVINSRGQVVELTESQNVLRLIRQETREQELSDFSKQLPLSNDCEKFCFLIQPSYTMEQILLITKTELASNSKAVKLSNELEKHPDILANKEQTEFLKSILPYEENGKRKWFYLTVGSIVFERNLYDCKPIDVNYVQPISYSTFIRKLKEQQSEDNENFRYSLITNGVNLFDSTSLLPLALERDIVNDTGSLDSNSIFDKKIIDFLSGYKKEKYSLRDKNSNKATTCISIINENCNNIFLIYQQVKKRFRKEFKSEHIFYENNCITVALSPKNKILLYASGTKDNPQFIVGGRVIVGLNNLVENIKNNNFEEMDWFTNNVKPYIKAEKKTKKQITYSKADVLGWNRKRKD